jgi:hypothetical protein
MARTGLEGLLAESGVKLGNDRILTVNPSLPSALDVMALTNPDAENAIAKAFNPEAANPTRFFFRNVRTVDPIEGGRGGSKTAEQLLLVPADIGVWAETNFDIDPTELAEQLRRSRERLIKTLSRKHLCMAVTVTEGSAPPPGMPRDMAHAGLGKKTPRMVVFGSASWITDESLARGVVRMDLFQSCVSWLRDRAAPGGGSGGATKKRKDYESNISPEVVNRVLWLPLVLMMMTVIVLGTGVWVVRRR